MKLNYDTIAKQIKYYRSIKQISQAELAEEAEVSTLYISLIETARRKPSLEVLIKIASALNTTADNLLSEKPCQNSDSVISEMLADCSHYEKIIILETLIAVKTSLRKNENLLEGKK